METTLSLALTLTLLDIVGFGVSFYIWNSKRHGKKLVCPLGSNCEAVVQSKFSSALGVPLEVFGMLYYASLFVLSVIGTSLIPLPKEIIAEALIIVTGSAALVSLGLIAVQIFILKELCTWCITSSLISFAIFTVMFMS